MGLVLYLVFLLLAVHMSKTLVIVLSETRAHELTFDNFKRNVIDVLGADLCVCIGVTPSYDYSNPFYQLAKYRFLYTEPDDYGDAFDEAYDQLTRNRPVYEELRGINGMYGTLEEPVPPTTSTVHYYGNTSDALKDALQRGEDDTVVVHTSRFADPLWRNRVYGLPGHTENVLQAEVTTYKKPLHWRAFLKLKNQFMGGVLDPNPEHQHPGSAGILIFFRWFLLKNMREHGLLNKYDRFVITRSDFIYQLPHPRLELLDKSFMWFPDSEHYGGLTDRHVVLSKNTIESYLNLFQNMVLRSNEYVMKMESHEEWNLEKLICFNLKQQHRVVHIVREFPYVMYSVRSVGGSTRWAEGEYSETHGYCIKYHTEYDRSSYYKKCHDNLKCPIDAFYTLNLTLPNL